MRPPTSMNSYKTFLPSIQSLSAACREGGLPTIDQSFRTGESDSSSSQTSEDRRYSQPYTINQGVSETSSNQVFKRWLGALAAKAANEHEDEKVRKAAIWGERKFIRTVVCLGMLFRGIHGKAFANIIDKALIAREKVIKRNANGKYCETNEWKLACVYETQKQRQADGSVHTVSILASVHLLHGALLKKM
ncbi:hypothetical protein G9A89_008719 [Geosiphon pyriformis]|nr:hypothetical protein G9A89_008719 [Geosiphon pyriformis]